MTATVGVIRSEADRRAFIRANTTLLPVPHAPEISLHLAHEAIDLWTRTEEELEEIGLPPPFWAFAWAGGQALARYILDAPELVRGKRVYDFASGSGLVAIAARLAGAASVRACDIDPFALAAMAFNAQENGVEIVIEGHDVTCDDPPACDVLVCGDVFYEKPMAEKVLAWADRVREAGALVLIGDPGRSYLPRNRLEQLAVFEVPVTRALEDSEIKRTGVYRLKAADSEETAPGKRALTG
ncbi:putative nicotinamide N-methyase [Breoghania corrubedonensis]|uniref:Putative nicotinamide N-methyase n=1 Tax=Breoghania corrubedonensis TaxID=665038 RepID=A0A2T5UNC9_9HYPH|nr:methyltransferase [Breoghania corrubedonensis]PTW52951.1 putative nicotinamide N-methyase [Breoghania corrubedonensis]